VRRAARELEVQPTALSVLVDREYVDRTGSATPGYSADRIGRTLAALRLGRSKRTADQRSRVIPIVEIILALLSHRVGYPPVNHDLDRVAGRADLEEQVLIEGGLVLLARVVSQVSVVTGVAQPKT
jgi:hypothetical protein